MKSYDLYTGKVSDRLKSPLAAITLIRMTLQEDWINSGLEGVDKQ